MYRCTCTCTCICTVHMYQFVYMYIDAAVHVHVYVQGAVRLCTAHVNVHVHVMDTSHHFFLTSPLPLPHSSHHNQLAHCHHHPTQPLHSHHSNHSSCLINLTVPPIFCPPNSLVSSCWSPPSSPPLPPSLPPHSYLRQDEIPGELKGCAGNCYIYTV